MIRCLGPMVSACMHCIAGPPLCLITSELQERRVLDSGMAPALLPDGWNTWLL